MGIGDRPAGTRSFRYVADAGSKSYLPGVTLRSVCASLFALLLMGMYVQYAEVIQVSQGAIGEQVLPVPGMTVFLLLLAVAGLSQLLVGRHLLTRQEQFCM